MASGKDDFIIPSRKGTAEAKRFFKTVDDIRSSSGSLLKPDDVAGEYDFTRKLLTTMGGVPRAITIDDLKQFSHITKQQTAKYAKGIAAKRIIDFSLEPDRKRANQEIKTAVPIFNFGEQIKFMTNSGPNSDRERHYVVVNFKNFGPIVAAGIPVEKSGQEMSKSPLEISCSCGRWRYWLAYLATKGNYNSGHREDAFPKYNNPGLSGIACKHILRVMTLIHQSPFTKQYMMLMVKKARQKVEDKAEYEKVANLKDVAAELKKESWRQRQVKTSEQKRQERSAKNAANAAKQAEKPKKEKRMSKKITGMSPDQREAALRASMAQFGAVPTPEQIAGVRSAK
jgi:hypothetical protein